MATEPKARRDERWRENVVAATEGAENIVRSVVRYGAPLAAFAWAFWRIPFAWVGKLDADLIVSVRNAWPGCRFYTPQREGGQEVRVDVTKYDSTLPGIGDRLIFGSEYKVTPFTDKLLWAARTELRDDVTVALGPFMILFTAGTEIGVVEKAAVLTTFAAAQFAIVELMDFQPVDYPYEAWTRDGLAKVQKGTLHTYTLHWLDRFALAAQAPLLAHAIAGQYLKD